MTTPSEKRFARQYGPDWTQQCDNCGSKPVVPASGLCGPCHFGAADAVNGGWWDEAAQKFDSDFVNDHLPEES